MKYYEAARLVKHDLKKAIVAANNEGDSWRVDYLKNIRRKIKKKLFDFYKENGMIPKDRQIHEMFNQ